MAYELAEHVKIRQPGMAMRRARARASRARWEVIQAASQEQPVHSPCTALQLCKKLKIVLEIFINKKNHFIVLIAFNVNLVA